MKKIRVTTLIAIPLLALSSMAYAAEPASEQPVQLTAAQMDGVTAGSYGPAHRPWWSFAAFKRSEVTQINAASPVTIVQIGYNNTAVVYSGNFSSIYQ